MHVTPGARTRLTCFRVSPPKRGRVAGEFAWSNFVPTVTVLVRRSCLDEIACGAQARLSFDRCKAD